MNTKGHPTKTGSCSRYVSYKQTNKQKHQKWWTKKYVPNEEKERSTEKELNKTKASDLSDTEFKAMGIRILNSMEKT